MLCSARFIFLRKKGKETVAKIETSACRIKNGQIDRVAPVILISFF